MTKLNITLRKLDNGFKAFVIESGDETIVPLGKNVFNRKLKQFAAGTAVLAEVHVSKTGRMMFDSLTLSDGTHEPKKVEVVKKEATLGYFINEESRLVYTTADALAKRSPQRAVKVMMVGPSGYGKTTLPKLFAEVTGRRFLRMNCATVRDPEEWFGYREAQEGSTVFIRSQFAREITKGDLVVVLDEFNRLEPWLHNTLFPLLDDDGATVVHDEEFRIGPNVIVVGTINSGYRFTGTFELDEALLNRFDFLLEVGAMPHNEEVKVLKTRTGISHAQAGTIVKVSNVMRQNDIVCSTRTSLNIANMVVSGMTLREAFESAVVLRVPTDGTSNSERKKVIDLVNTHLGVLEVRNVSGDVFGEPESPAVIKVEQEQEPEVGVEPKPVKEAKVLLTLERASDKNLLAVGLIVALRRLPVVTGELSLGEANVLVSKLSSSYPVVLELSHEPEDMSEIAAEFRRCGLTGSFRRL